jgi:hypothetical protein
VDTDQPGSRRANPDQFCIHRIDGITDTLLTIVEGSRCRVPRCESPYIARLAGEGRTGYICVGRRSRRTDCNAQGLDFAKDLLVAVLSA